MESKKGINLFLEVTNLDGDLGELSEIAEQLKTIIKNYRRHILPCKFDEDIIIKKSEVYVNDK